MMLNKSGDHVLINPIWLSRVKNILNNYDKLNYNKFIKNFNIS